MQLITNVEKNVSLVGVIRSWTNPMLANRQKTPDNITIRELVGTDFQN